jgi:soluble lytic murein transglycosylase-like protein
MAARVIGLHTCLLVATVLGAPSAQAQGPFGRGPVYANEAACVQTSRLRPEQCHNAFANAQAELSNTAPRFQSREECTAYFRRCSIVSFTSSQDVTLQPTLEGVRIVRAAGGLAVTPVLSGRRPIPLSRPRTIDALRTEQSLARRKAAQIAWQQPNRFYSLPRDLDPGASEPVDPQVLAAIATQVSAGIDSVAFRRMAWIESRFKPHAFNPQSNAAGLFQFIPSTARRYGLTNPFDPFASAEAAARLWIDNAVLLTKGLGRTPTSGELYLAHQQGAAGALRLLTNPQQPATQLVGEQAVILNGGYYGMSAAEFTQLWVKKFD